MPVKTTAVIGVVAISCALVSVAPAAQAETRWTSPSKTSGNHPAVAISADGRSAYTAWIDDGALKVTSKGRSLTAATGVDKGVTPALAAYRGGAVGLFGLKCMTISPQISAVTIPGWTVTGTPPIAQENCLSLGLRASADGSALLATWEASTDVTDVEAPTRLRSSVSTDGGKTWSAPTDVPLQEASSRPIFALSADGTRAVAASTRSAPGDRAVQVTVSEDGGKTWGSPQDVASGTVDLISLDLDASPDLRHLAMIWSRSTSRSDQNYTSTSHTSGATWSKPTELGKPGDYPDAAIGISDNGKKVAAVWTRNTSAWSQTLMAARSGNGGKTWGKPTAAVTSKTGKFFPSFEVSADGKRLVALWSGALSRNGKQAVVSATSTGSKWTITTLQRMKGSPMQTSLALSASGKRAVAAWTLGAKNPNVYRVQGRLD